MTSARLIAAALGAVALFGLLLLGLSGVPVLISYLAAWLIWMALPLGALPVLMGLELAGRAASPLAPALRRMLIMLPMGAVFALPILLHPDNLYHWHAQGFAAIWFTPGAFIIRSLVFLTIWVFLSIIFAFAPPVGEEAGRTGWAAFGLIVHAVIGTLAATDWAMSLEPQFGSSCFGLLLMAVQCGMAISVATLLAGPAAPSRAAGWMLALLGAWVFLHFIQFLVVWSADLPREILWYQRRANGLGRAAETLAAAGSLIALVVLIPQRLARLPRPVASVAVLLLAVHLLEIDWLITPALRGRFSLSAGDLLGGIGMVGLAFALLAAKSGVRHGVG